MDENNTTRLNRQFIKPLISAGVGVAAMNMLPGAVDYSIVEIMGKDVNKNLFWAAVFGLASFGAELSHNWILPHIHVSEKWMAMSNVAVLAGSMGTAVLLGAEVANPNLKSVESPAKLFALGAGIEVLSSYAYDQLFEPYQTQQPKNMANVSEKCSNEEKEEEKEEGKTGKKRYKLKRQKNFHDITKEPLVLELCNIFGKPYKFVRGKRPSFLKNPETSRNLELDIWCPELNLAFEYQSRIHFEFDSFIHKTKEKFEGIQQRDKLKEELCKKAGVRLVIVPYWISVEDLPALLEKIVKDQIASFGENNKGTK